MKQLEIVDPKHIYQLWDTLKPFFESSEEQGSGDSSVEHIKTAIIQGTQVLFVITDNTKIVGTFAVEMINYTNHRVAHVTALAGNEMFDTHLVEQFEAWAKHNGATKIRAWAKDSQARLYRLKMGLNKSMNIVEKILD